MLDERDGATPNSVLHTHLIPHVVGDLPFAELLDPREIRLGDGHGFSI
jgi:hypothetical protein